MDDLISRQDAIRWVKTECNPYGKPTLDFESGTKVIEHLKQMPSAERTGHWILVKGSNGKDYDKCSECLHTQEITGVKNYCAVCGARMKGGEQNE